MKISYPFCWLAVLYYVLFPSMLAGQEADQLLREADSSYAAYEEEQALNLYQQVLDEEPNHYRALWRSSFLHARIGNRLDTEEKKKECFDRAIQLAERALEVDSTDSQSNFVMAVAMGRKALISGAKDRVAASRAIKKYADLAIKYDSTHAGAWHVLGRWHFKVANLSWVERLAANTLFGGVPGNASNQKAAESIRKAISLNDKYILYYYDLARIYEELDREKEAIETCQTAMELPLLTPDDLDLKNQCQQLIQNI
ncbi:hypothetical protein [Fodinibius sediminis]|uniref:Regulator of microtubule dynamics protein 1 n=1 Tax=Fodinibius sediminis TaxID=1214077 RepID=A0A521DAX1_9BACT|nr:hypothetical protein [Fodinibius sediminis]SMO68795.1 Tetratricopeptide repeat-containing protein [Fodinibius sediminis]